MQGLRKNDYSSIFWIAVILLLIPLLFVPGFPFVLWDKDVGILWNKPLVVIFAENVFPIGMAVVLAVLIVMMRKMI